MPSDVTATKRAAMFDNYILPNGGWRVRLFRKQGRRIFDIAMEEWRESDTERPDDELEDVKKEWEARVKERAMIDPLTLWLLSQIVSAIISVIIHLIINKWWHDRFEQRSEMLDLHG